jgi:hypothetical protein
MAVYRRRMAGIMSGVELAPAPQSYDLGGSDRIINYGEHSAILENGEWRTEKNKPEKQLFCEFLDEYSKQEMLMDLQKEFAAEFDQYAAYLKGEKRDPEFYILRGCRLYYIPFPRMFEDRLEYIGQFAGEFTAADMAWINNSRELINAYHQIYEGEMMRILPVSTLPVHI